MWQRWSAVLLLAAVLLPAVAAQCASGVSINGVCLSPHSIIVLKVLAVVQIAAGLYLVLFGFRLWKITSGVCGFLFGFFFMFYLMHWILHSNPHNVWIGLGTGIGVGLGLGILLFLFPVLSLVVLCIFCGLVAGILLYNVALVYIKWRYIYYVSLGVGALLFLLLGLCIKRAFLIFATSMYGSFAVAYGIATFAGGFPIFVDPHAASAPRPPNYWHVYIYVVGIVVGTIVGIILQYRIFAKDLTWKDVSSRVCPRRGLTDDGLSTPLMDMGSSGKKKKKKFRRKKNYDDYDEAATGRY